MEFKRVSNDAIDVKIQSKRERETLLEVLGALTPDTVDAGFEPRHWDIIGKVYDGINN